MKKMNVEKRKEIKETVMNIGGRVLLYVGGLVVVFLATYYGIIYALS